MSMASVPGCVVSDPSVHPDLWAHYMMRAFNKAKASPRFAKLVTLDDLLEETDQEAMLSSPRSLRACIHLGIDPSEVIHRPFQAFAVRGVSKDLQKLKFDHYETHRKDKLNKLNAERERIMKEGEGDPTSRPGTGSKELLSRIAEKQRTLDMKFRQRQEVIRDIQISRQRKIQEMENKAHQADLLLQAFITHKQLVNARRMIEHQLDLDERQEKVENMRRQEAFERIQALKKMEIRAEKVQELMEGRDLIQEHRKKTHAKMMMNRQHMKLLEGK